MTITDLPRVNWPRFWSKIDRSGPNGCHLWRGVKQGSGYGMFLIGSKIDQSRRMEYAHRLAYLFHNAHIPDGFELDHLCRTPLCVNRQHLEAVTSRENKRRAFLVKDTGCCPSGHPFTPENTYRNLARPSRMCRTCHRERVLARYHNDPVHRERVKARVAERQRRKKEAAQ